MWLYEDNSQCIFPLQKLLFFSLLTKRPPGSLKPNMLPYPNAFCFITLAFFVLQALLGDSRWCMHAIVLKQGLFLSGRFPVTPAKGSRNTKVSLVRHQALCLSIAVLTEDMLASHGGVRCRAVDVHVVQDSPVWVYSVFYNHGSLWSALRSQLVSYKKITH